MDEAARPDQDRRQGESSVRVRPVRPEDADALEKLVNDVIIAEVGLPIYEPGGLRKAREEGEPFDRHRAIEDATNGIEGLAWIEVDEGEPSFYFELYCAPGSEHFAPVLIEAAEEQAAELAARAKRALEVECNSGNKEVIRVLERAGYVKGKTHLPMLIDLVEAPPPAWPAGMSPRTYVEGRDDALMYATIRRGFGEDWHDPEDQEAWLKKHRASSYDPRLWFFAVDANDTVLGAVHSRTSWEGSTEAGWVRNLAVLPEARRRGVGRALLLESFARIRSLGRIKVILGVDEVNESGALDLYKGVGMHEGGRSTDLAKTIEPA